MKKLNKIFISLAMVLMFALPLLLTGCSASAEEIGRIALAARENYLSKYEDYENFKNITYKTTSKRYVKEEVTLNYKENSEDEEFKTGVFTNIEKGETITTYSFKKMDDEDLALYVKIKGNNKEIGYEVNDDVLDKINSSESYVDEYILSFTKDEEGNKTYYILNNYTWKNVEESGSEYLYYAIGRANYVGYIESVMQKLQYCAMNSYFFTTSEYDWEGREAASYITNFSEKNGKVTASFKFKFPYARYDEGDLYAGYTSHVATASFTKSGLDKVKAENIEISEYGEAKISKEMVVLSSANGSFKVPSLEDREENGSVVSYINNVVISEIPSCILDIFPPR